MDRPRVFLDNTLPDLAPVIAHEVTGHGWRGLTADGEVLQVNCAGEPNVPESITEMRDGRPVGRRTIDKSGEHNIDIGEYLRLFEHAADLHRANTNEAALAAIDAAIAIAPTIRAHFNRALFLLSLGRWREGFKTYVACEECWPMQRPLSQAAAARGLLPWNGEQIPGKRLLLLHDHGFGDTIMTLRYVAMLRHRDIDVIMLMPPELQRLAAQCGVVSANSIDVVEADYFCPMLLLPYAMGAVTPDKILGNVPLRVDSRRVDEWRAHLRERDTGRPRIGIAWSVGVEHPFDYPRSIPLLTLVDALGDGLQLHSVQLQEPGIARALGVAPHEFADFADCAAFMCCMDRIISVDTAALHLAGAIEHPDVIGLLSFWSSWRWLAPWYPTVQLRSQSAAGDWASVFK